MAQAPFANGSYRLPQSVDTGGVKSVEMPNTGGILGGALQQAGALVGQVGEQIGRQNDQAAVNEAMTSFQNHVRNVQYGNPDDPESKGFLTLQGKAAMQGWQGASSDLDTVRQQIAETLTPSQQRLYAQQSSSLQTSALNSMASHVAGQRQVWVKQSNIARSDQLRDTAVANRADPAAMQSAISAQMQIADQQSASEGLPSNDPIAIQRRAAVFGDTAKAMVRGYIADGDPIGAQHFLDANGKSLPEDVRDDLTLTLRHPVIEKKAEIWARHEFGPSLNQIQPISADANISDLLVSQEMAESGGRQFGKDGSVLRSMPGDADSPRGVMQIKPSAAKGAADYAGIQFDPKRLDSDAAYNRGIGHAEMYRLCQKYGNNFTLACAAYNWGQGNVDKTIREYGDPRTGAVSDADFLSHAPSETQKYVTKIQSGLKPQQPPPSSTAPDFEQATRSAMSGPDWEENMAKLSQVSRIHSIWDAETQTARSNLSQTLNNLNDQRLHGNMAGQFPPEAAQLLTGPELQEARSKFDAASDAGSQWKAVQWMPPTLQAAYLSQREADLQDTDAPNYAIRREGLTQLTSQIKRSNDRLAADPASYVQAHPAMQQALATLQAAEQSSDPAQIASAQGAYIQQSDAVQRSMGVQQPRILTDDQISTLGGEIQRQTQSKDGAGAIIDTLEKTYGPKAWPRVAVELQKKNAIDGDVLAYSLIPPQNVADRAKFQRALTLGTFEQVKKSAGAQAESDVTSKTSGIDANATMRDFRNSLAYGSGGAGVYAQMSKAVQRLAYAEMAEQNTDSATAMQDAIQTVIGNSYDMSSMDQNARFNIRTPKGLLRDAQAAADQTTGALTSGDLAEAHGNEKLTQSERQNILLGNAQSGTWVTSPDDGGITLMRYSKTGVPVPVYLKDGKTPVEVRFEDVRAGKYAPAPAAPNTEPFRLAYHGGR